MNVIFRTRALEKCYESQTAAVRKWGNPVGRLYVTRIDMIHACATLEDLKAFPQLHFHALTGNRKGQYSVWMDGYMRLILTIPDEKDPSTVRIEEVSKHYGD